MTCLTCARFSLAKAGAIGRLGFGRCELDTLAGMTKSYQHKCDKRQAVPEVEAARRRGWEVKFTKGG